jgi:hypothetical protein
MKLTRFRGHPNICVQGVPDGEDETTLHPGIPSPDGRVGPGRPLTGGADARVSGTAQNMYAEITNDEGRRLRIRLGKTILRSMKDIFGV